jgi:DNA ligase (NAD+)
VIAYKYETEQQPTVLNGVRWQVGKGGSLTPVGDLEPVFIGGVTVTHVSMHNVDQIRKLDVHLGDTVVVERAGEVIPQIVQVIDAKRPAGAVPVPAPDACPECEAKVEWEAYPDEVIAYRCLNKACEEYWVRRRVKRAKKPDDCPTCHGPIEALEKGIDLYCVNPACPAQLKERLRWYCGRSQMDIEGLGDKLVDQLVDRGLVKSFADLYGLKIEDIATLGSEVIQNEKTVKRTVGEKVAQRVVDNIANSRKQGLDRLLGGLGIRHVGTRVAYVLASNFGSLDALAAASEEELAGVHEIGEVIADSVSDFFGNEAGKQTVASLQAVGVNPTMAVAPKPAAGEAAGPTDDRPLAGQTVVVTGSLAKFTRPQIEEYIVKLGGRASGSVSKKTSFLVAGAEAGSKLAKAQSLNVPVLNEDDFLEKYGAPEG